MSNKLIRKFRITAISPIRALIVLETKNRDISGVLTINPEIIVPFIKLVDPAVVVVPNPSSEIFPDDFASEIVGHFPIQSEFLFPEATGARHK